MPAGWARHALWLPFLRWYTSHCEKDRRHDCRWYLVRIHRRRCRRCPAGQGCGARQPPPPPLRPPPRRCRRPRRPARVADAISAAIARCVAICLVAAAAAAATAAVAAAVITAAAATLTLALSTVAAGAACRTALACGRVVVLQWQARRRRRVDGALPSVPHYALPTCKCKYPRPPSHLHPNLRPALTHSHSPNSHPRPHPTRSRSHSSSSASSRPRPAASCFSPSRSASPAAPAAYHPDAAASSKNS